MRDSMTGDALGRVEALRPALQRQVTDLGYQGVTQDERDAAIVFDALEYAIQHGKVAGLARVASKWMDSNALP